MMYPKYSTLEGILVALSIPSALVNGYDCSSISGRDSCSDESSVIGYSQCKLQTYSISAFIQCASQSDAADFSATTDDDGGSKDISATDVLTNGLTPNGIPLAGCGDVPLAGNILRTANNHGSVNFARYLCDQYHPLNTGLCRLRNCLLPDPTAPEEHSLKAFCSDNKLDLMNEVILPSSCGAGDPNDVDSDSSTPAYPSDSSSPTDEAINSSSSSSSSGPTQSSSPSAASTTSPSANNSATPTSGATTSPTPQATLATGAASRWGVTSFDLVNRLGLTVLLILAF